MDRTAVVTAVLVTIAFHGCAAVTYRSAVPTKGQDAAMAELDEQECRDRAERDVASPLTSGLGTKLAWALGGAMAGAVAMATASLPDRNGQMADGKVIAFAVGGGAALGFVIGSTVGTFKGADVASRSSRARQEVFTRCMTERGYRVE